MTEQLLSQYTRLVDFLGRVLGPDYEIILHEILPEQSRVAAIANGGISGRDVGAPITDAALRMIIQKQYESKNYIINYTGQLSSGKTLRSSTMFIKDGGKLVGLLCINFDDSRYRAISDHILKLCHPDLFVTDVLAQPLPESEDDMSARSSPEKFRNSADAVALDAINRELERMGVTPEQLTPEVIARMASPDKLCPQFHLSLQSGCDATSLTASGFRSSLLWNPPAFFC